MYIPAPDYRPPTQQATEEEVPRNPGEPDYFRPVYRPPAHLIPYPDYTAKYADPNRMERKDTQNDYYPAPVEHSYRHVPAPEPVQNRGQHKGTQNHYHNAPIEQSYRYAPAPEPVPNRVQYEETQNDYYLAPIEQSYHYAPAPGPLRERAPTQQLQPMEYSRSRAPSFTPAPRQFHVPVPQQEVHRGFVIDPEPDQFVMPQDPVVPTPEDVPRHHYVPKVPQRDNFIAHSYVEDKDKVTGVINDGTKSTRSHIRAIGVSVLPPIGGSDSNDFGGGVNPMRNRAFMRHLENHRNFDTMKSLKSCRECPICQLFLNEGLEIPNNMQHHFEPQPAVEIQNQKQRRGDVRDLFGAAEVPSAPATNWSLTRRSYAARSEGEISVDFREKIEVIRREGTHVLCQKRDGTMGWVPSYIVM